MNKVSETSQQIASVSTSVDRARRKLGARIQALTAQMDAEALAASKAKNQLQLDRRSAERKVIAKETFSQFADCKTIENESAALRKIREKLSCGR